jgi:hypothetical protein
VEDDQTTAEVGDFEPGEFDLDDDEREEIEAEFGTEFQSGTEVDDPGEAEIGTPEPDGTTAEPSPGTDDSKGAAEVEGVPGGDTSTAPADQNGTVDDAGAGAGEAGADDVDLEDATLEVMAELDDGAGADRQAVVETVTERYGTGPGSVEEAIQDALMDGRCYEPDDATLKPI